MAPPEIAEAETLGASVQSASKRRAENDNHPFTEVAAITLATTRGPCNATYRGP